LGHTLDVRISTGIYYAETRKFAIYSTMPRHEHTDREGDSPGIRLQAKANVFSHMWKIDPIQIQAIF
jgi:hypothetical protein